MYGSLINIVPARYHSPFSSGQTRGPPESPEQGETPPASDPAQIIPGQKYVIH